MHLRDSELRRSGATKVKSCTIVATFFAVVEMGIIIGGIICQKVSLNLVKFIYLIILFSRMVHPRLVPRYQTLLFQNNFKFFSENRPRYVIFNFRKFYVRYMYTLLALWHICIPDVFYFLLI